MKIKVDRFELNKIYELKSNKQDIGLLMSIMEKIHDHIKQQSTIN